MVEPATLDRAASAQVAYFVNSGSEANDMAMLMARLYSGNYDLLALRNCYHGMSEGTMGLTAHSTWKYNVPQVSQSTCSLDLSQRCLYQTIVAVGKQVSEVRSKFMNCIK